MAESVTLIRLLRLEYNDIFGASYDEYYSIPGSWVIVKVGSPVGDTIFNLLDQRLDCLINPNGTGLHTSDPMTCGGVAVELSQLYGPVINL